jgi:hypothetical protein
MIIGKLKDGGKLECDVSSLVDTRLLIQANYGGGKSWLLRLIDETNQRLFVGCRRPARLLVSDTSLGETVAKMKAWGDTDNLFYDGAAGRYISQLVRAASASSRRQIPATIENFTLSLRLWDRAPRCSCRLVGHCMLPSRIANRRKRRY